MGFQKAKPGQAFLKLALYGTQGTGKTLTALLIAEGLAKRDGKRIAFIDTERGTDFYAMDIPERKVHPKAFDFDALYSRSITEALTEVKGLDTKTYGVVVIDSITHLWNATMDAFTGQRMKNGQIPIQAWGPLKRPYKQLMAAGLDGEFHLIINGRQSLQMEKDEDGDNQVVGTKMKAEGETGYEPHILGQMRQVHEQNPDKTFEKDFKIQCFFEKDRSGILGGRTIDWPNYATFEPVVNHLSGGSQAKMGNVDDASEKDAEAIARAQEAEERERAVLFSQIKGAIQSAKSLDELRSAWDLVTGKKKKLGPEFVEQLEEAKETVKRQLVEAA